MSTNTSIPKTNPSSSYLSHIEKVGIVRLLDNGFPMNHIQLWGQPQGIFIHPGPGISLTVINSVIITMDGWIHRTTLRLFIILAIVPTVMLLTMM